ncbi:hypothetical protein D3C81_821180 [compost metagenome]
MKIRPAEPRELGIGVREQPRLQQRIVGEIHARQDVAGVKRHLLGFGEEVVRVAVQHHPAHAPYRRQFLGNELGRVLEVEAELEHVGLGHQLHAELVLGKLARLDRVVEVAPMEIGVLAVDLDRLVPDQRMRAAHRLPVELDQRALPLGIDKAEGVHAKPFHRAETARDGAAGHGPQHHVHRLGLEGDEVPERVVRRRGLRDLVVRFRLHGMDEIRELDAVLDKEHRDVVADQIEVSLPRIKLGGGAARAGHGRKSHEHRRLLADLGEQLGGGHIGERLGQLEIAMGRRAARVDHALGNALVVEVRDLLAQVEVLEQRGAAQAEPEGVVVLRNLEALVRGQRAVTVRDDIADRVRAELPGPLGQPVCHGALIAAVVVVADALRLGRRGVALLSGWLGGGRCGLLGHGGCPRWRYGADWSPWLPQIPCHRGPGVRRLPARPRHVWKAGILGDKKKATMRAHRGFLLHPACKTACRFRLIPPSPI